MNIQEVLTPRAIAAHWTESASNRIPYLGAGLFPARKKAGLDLRFFRGHKGLPVSLAPSNFDAKATLMERGDFSIQQNEMAFFRASMIIKERDRQDIRRAADANDPYLTEAVGRIFNDTDTLIGSADVVAERMRMQLLCPTVDGSPRIVIAGNNVQYSYNYDADGTYKAKNYKALSAAADKWTDHAKSDPLGDLIAAQDAVEALSGTRPTRVLMNRTTFNHLKLNEKLRSAVLAQNATANVFMNDARVNEVLSSELGLTAIIYNKQYRDGDGNAQKFYSDGFCTLLPEGAMGNTWYGITPEEGELAGSGEARVSVVNTGVAITVFTNVNPVFTETIASEIVLPSFERMDETFALKVF